MPRLTIIVDANILFSAPLRDFFMHLGIADAVRLCWSAKIEEEWVRNLIEKRPDLESSRHYRTARQMNEAIPDALIADFEGLESTLKLPDSSDRHVLAAAIKANADAIITKNLRDFPNSILAEYGIKALHPDEFVHELLQLESMPVLVAIRALQVSLKNPPKTMFEVLHTLEEQGLQRSVTLLKEFLDA